MVSIQVVTKGVLEDDTSRILIAEERDSIDGRLLEITEADDIPEGFRRAVDTIRTGEGLDQPVIAEVLIDKERIEAGRVEAREEHPHDDQEVYLPSTHTACDILIVVLEGSPVEGEVRTKELVVIGDSGGKELLTTLIHGTRLEALIRELALGGLLFVGRKGEDRGDT